MAQPALLWELAAHHLALSLVLVARRAQVLVQLVPLALAVLVVPREVLLVVVDPFFSPFYLMNTFLAYYLGYALSITPRWCSR